MLREGKRDWYVWHMVVKGLRCAHFSFVTAGLRLRGNWYKQVSSVSLKMVLIGMVLGSYTAGVYCCCYWRQCIEVCVVFLLHEHDEYRLLTSCKYAVLWVVVFDSQTMVFLRSLLTLLSLYGQYLWAVWELFGKHRTCFLSVCFLVTRSLLSVP